MTVRWLTPLTIITVLLTASCGQQAGTEDRGEQGRTASSAVTPFAAFLASVRSASYGDYAGRPGTGVRNRQAFEEMREFLLARYRNARVTRSYAAGDAVFDCVEPPAGSAGSPAPAGSPAGPGGLPAAVSGQAACPGHSVPMRRIALGDLARFPTLRQYLSKDPGGSGSLPPAGRPS